MKWKPDWYWLGMLILAQALVVVSAIAGYECAQHPRTSVSVPK